MISATQKSNPAGSSLLGCFRFDGFEVAHGFPPLPSGTAGPQSCDVLLELDFAGTGRETLADRLAAAGRRLAGDGVLLLALPNRFGLRFWSGCPEPATGRLFATLTGPGASPAAAEAPAGRRRHFVSRYALSEAIAAAGFSVLEWFYAAPDGAETGTSGALVSEHLVATAPELASELLSARPSADASRARLDLFPEALVSRELARSGLLTELANYFLVAVAPRRPAPGTSIWPHLRPPAAEIGWHFAGQRREPVATVFERSASGVTVAKRRIDRPGTPPASTARAFGWSAPERAPLAAGEPLRLRLQELLVGGRFEPFLDELGEFSAAVRERFGRGKELAGEALDATLSNATRDPNGAFHLFDLEWRALAGMPHSWWILRNVLACLEMRGPRWSLVPTAAELYSTLCRRLAVAPQLAADLAREAEFAGAARVPSEETGESLLEAALAHPWPVPVAQGLDTAEIRSALERTAAHQQLVADYRKLEHWAEEANERSGAAESAYRRLEAWAMDVQRANETALAEYRKLAEWAAALDLELRQRDSRSPG